MIIKPKLKGSLALNCHPKGCFEFVDRQIDYINNQEKFNGPKKVLIIGASSGYGLSSRIALAFGANADTIGVAFEKAPDSKRPGTAGWWNTIEVTNKIKEKGLIAKNFIGDAFSNEMKDDVVKYIKDEFGGKIDLLVYSLASGIRTDPNTGETYYSSLKASDNPVVGPTINLEKEIMEEGIMEVGTEKDLHDTIKVMGGEDWELWINALDKAGVLENNFKTVAYSYLGPDITRGIYENGTIGAAKRHLEDTSERLNKFLKEKYNGESFISLSKALMTKASAYIPIMPLYAAILYRVMKDKGLHEGTIEQKYRLFKDMIYGDKMEIDEYRRIRLDSWEMKPEVQSKVNELWSIVNEDNFKEVSDFIGIKDDFMNLNGFDFDNINYDEDLDMEQLEKLNP